MDWEQSLQRVSSNSLLISTSSFTLVRFYCPISATCISPIAHYQVGERVSIDGIYQNPKEQLLYLIDGLRLPYSNFQLTLKTN